MEINRYTTKQFIDFLAQFLPDGRAMASKYCISSDLRLYLEGKAHEFNRLQDTMATFLEELDPRTTNIFLDEWESALDIPDKCVPKATDIQERRDNIVLKLTSLSVQTEEDFKNLATQFGFTIEFEEDDSFTYTFPITFPDGSSCTGGFPYKLPLVFVSGNPAIDKFLWCIRGNFDTNPEKAETFQCLVRLLAPAVYKVVFVNT